MVSYDTFKQILSVLDTDGSEIIRKPVQLVKAGKTFGAPTDARRPSHDFDGRKNRNHKHPTGEYFYLSCSSNPIILSPGIGG